MSTEAFFLYTVPFLGLGLLPFVAGTTLKRHAAGSGFAWFLYVIAASITVFVTVFGTVEQAGPFTITASALWLCLCCLEGRKGGWRRGLPALMGLLSAIPSLVISRTSPESLPPYLAAPYPVMACIALSLAANALQGGPVPAYLGSLGLMLPVLPLTLEIGAPTPAVTAIGLAFPIVAGAYWLSSGPDPDPLADAGVMGDLGEPAMLLDDEQVITRANAAAKSLLWGDKGVRIIGRAISELIPLNADSVTLETPGGRRGYEIRVNTLRSRGGATVTGYLVVLSPAAMRPASVGRSPQAAGGSFELAIEAVRDSVWEWNVRDGSLSLSPHLYRAFGYPEAEVPRTVAEWRALVHPEDLADLDTVLGRLGSGFIEEVQQDLRIRGRKDGWHWVHVRGRIVERAPEGGIVRVVGVQSDSSIRRAKEALLSYRALYDELTDLPNRFLLLDRLQQEISRVSRQHTGFALVFCDVNDFKGVNDTFGHSGGDELLRQMAKRLVSCIRETDTVGRLGGDEFVLVLPGQGGSVAETRTVLDRIVRVMKEPFVIDGNTVHSSLSMGVAMAPEHGRDTETLMRSADTAMYTAKSRGGTRYIFYSPALLGTGITPGRRAGSRFAAQMVRKPEPMRVAVGDERQADHNAVRDEAKEPDKDTVLVN